MSGFTRATTLPETFQGDSSSVDTRTWLYHGLISGELYVNVCYSAPVSFSIDSTAISEHLSALVFIFFNKLEEGLCPFPRLTCFLLFTSFFSLKFSPFNPSVYQLSQLFFFFYSVHFQTWNSKIQLKSNAVTRDPVWDLPGSDLLLVVVVSVCVGRMCVYLSVPPQN